jgi:hypothetical protein
MPKKLEDLEIDEVSLVDRPSNPGAKVTIFKRGETISKAEIEAMLDRLAQERADRSGEDFHQAYVKVLDSQWGKELYEQLIEATPRTHDN